MRILSRFHHANGVRHQQAARRPFKRTLVLSGALSALFILPAQSATRLSARQAFAQTSPTSAATTTTTIPVGAGPVGVAVDRATNTTYVANASSNSVSVIDGATNTVTHTISVGSAPYMLALNEATDTIYVPNSQGRSVSVIDGATNTVTATIRVGRNPFGLAVNPATNTVYVGNAADNTISVISGATKAVAATISGVANPVQVAVNSSTNTIYASGGLSNALTVIKGATNTVTATIRVGAAPRGIGVNQTTNTLYVANSGYPRAGDTVSIINGATNAVTATVAVGMYPFGVAVDPSANTVYVTNLGSNTVSVIDGATNAVTASVGVGRNPYGVAVDQTTNTVYVANNGSNAVSVFQGPAAAPSQPLWFQLAPAGPLPPRRLGGWALAGGFDQTNDRLMLFGGLTSGPSGVNLNDTWVLAGADGTASAPHWIHLATASTPAARHGHQGAYDAVDNRLIVFSGCLGYCTPLDTNTYVLSNANGLGGTPTWTQLRPTGGPPPGREGATALYDPTGNRLIVFGGDNGFGGDFNDAWVLSNASGLGGTPTWTQLRPIGGPPPGRAYHSAVYDATSNRMVVFGGLNEATHVFLNDTWVLSHANGLGGTPIWTKLAPIQHGTVPGPRYSASAVYDAAANQVVIFGGCRHSGSNPSPCSQANDTWVLSNANGLGGTPAWHQVRPVSTLPLNSGLAAYRAASNRMVVYEGDPTDTWVLLP